MILVVPWWVGKAYFPALLDLLLDVRRIPVREKMIVDLTTGQPPPDLHRLKLTACLITGRSELKRSRSPRLLSTWLKLPGGGQQRKDTGEHGENGASGVACKEYRQLLHLWSMS